MNIIKYIFKGLFEEELNAAKKEIEIKDAQLAEIENEIGLLKESESSLQLSLENCKKSLEIKDKALFEKDEEIRKLTDTENRMKQTSQYLIIHLEEMDKVVCLLKKVELSLKTSNELKSKEIAEKEKEIAALNENIDSLRKKNINLNDTIKKKNEEIEILNENLTGLKEAQKSNNQKYKEVVERIEELETFNHEKSEENILLSSQLRSISDENKSTKESLRSAQEQIISLSHNIDDRISENNRLAKELDDIKNDKAKLNSVISALKDRIIEIEGKFDEDIKKSQNLQFYVYKIEKIIKEKCDYIEQLENKLKQYEISSQKIYDEDDIVEDVEDDENGVNDMEDSDDEKNVDDEEDSDDEENVDDEEDSDNNSSNSKKERKRSNLKNDNKNVDPTQKKQILRYPYRQKPTASVFELLTKDFPPIENENANRYTDRTINCIFNHRSNSMLMANDIFMKKSAEEISKIRIDLEDAVRLGIPYLTCPSCGNHVKISSRNVGYGEHRREVQFFTHAKRNIECDLKQTSSEISISEDDYQKYDSEVLREFRRNLTEALGMSASKNKGISEVKENEYVNSAENPLMKRRLADVTAKYNSHDLVFEIVTPITNIARFRDKEIFYYLNKKQVLWIFGMDSITDYSELTRAISKDILYFYKRNVFLFDLEAQLESKRRGELILKCNWLDENGEWYYQKDKQGKNGILISIDEITFDANYRPYYFDADEAYYRKNSDESEPVLDSIEELNRKISETYAYDRQRDAALNEMRLSNRGVQAYFNGFKWGFKYGDVIFIEPAFDCITKICDYYAIVEKQQKFGVVDRCGNIQLQPEYDMVELLANGRILYCNSGHWYIFGVIEPIAKYYPNDKILFKTISKENDIYCLILAHGSEADLPIEKYYFIDTKIVKKDQVSGKWRLWQSEDEVSADELWDDFKLIPELGFMIKSDDSPFPQDTDDTLKSKSQSTKSKKYSKQTKNPDSKKLYGWDLDDESCDGMEREDFDPTNNDNVKVIIDDDTVYADSDGEVLNLHTHNPINENSYIADNETGYRISQNNSGKYGVTKNAINIIPYRYDSLVSWGINKYIATQNNRYGIIDINNNILLDLQYTYISEMINGKSIVKTVNSEFLLYDNLTRVIPIEYGLKKTMLKNKWGIEDKYGNILVDFIYDEITSYNNTLIGIFGKYIEDLKIHYPKPLGFLALNNSKVNGKNFVSVGKLKLERRTLTKKNVGLLESFYITDWTEDCLPKVKSITLNKYTPSPNDRVHILNVGVQERVTIVGIQKGILENHLSRIIVMDTNQNMWAICSDEIINFSDFENKLFVSKIFKITKIRHINPYTSIWRIDRVLRRRFFNTLL